MRIVVLVFTAVAVMVAAACVDTDAPVSQACPDGTDPWVKYELFMAAATSPARSWTTPRGTPSSAMR